MHPWIKERPKWTLLRALRSLHSKWQVSKWIISRGGDLTVMENKMSPDQIINLIKCCHRTAESTGSEMPSAVKTLLTDVFPISYGLCAASICRGMQDVPWRRPFCKEQSACWEKYNGSHWLSGKLKSHWQKAVNYFWAQNAFSLKTAGPLEPFCSLLNCFYAVSNVNLCFCSHEIVHLFSPAQKPWWFGKKWE